VAGSTFYVDPERGSAQGGDTVLLRSGYHGAVAFAGDNAQTITIAAEKGQRPTLGLRR
jgi:preprotein translocase subunit YajC